MARKRSSTPVAREPIHGPAWDVLNPFTIDVDSNELIPSHRGWRFHGLLTRKSEGQKVIYVPINETKLDAADYQIQGLADFCVERKAKSDLFSSIGKRSNFKSRLQYIFDHYPKSAVVVESEICSIRDDPPKFPDPKTGLMVTSPSVESVMGTVQSWSLRFPTIGWWFLRSPRAAETWTFRLFEKHWKQSRE